MRNKPTWDDQPFTGGMGVPFTLPIKCSNPKRPLSHVIPLGSLHKRRRLEEELNALLAPPTTVTSSETEEAGPPPSYSPLLSPSEVPTSEAPVVPELDSPFEQFPEAEPAVTTSRRGQILPNRVAKSSYTRWKNLLPTLVKPFLTYSDSVYHSVPEVPNEVRAQCHQMCDSTSTIEILCLHLTHEYIHTSPSHKYTWHSSQDDSDYAKVPVKICDCQGLIPTLVSHGLFPTAPSKPKIAVSVHLLDFYSSLFERSCDAVNALAGALNTLYKKRGYILTDKKGEAFQDPFRRGLTHAIQWYDNLQVHIEQVIETAISTADAQNQSDPALRDEHDPSPFLTTPDAPSVLPLPMFEPSPQLRECARILQK
ncbi:hypothetical protein C0991_005472 [Blastosporella zonata]|nr:hypothetical protein C0991_005472 [Blastosporella zonata]